MKYFIKGGYVVFYIPSELHNKINETDILVSRVNFEPEMTSDALNSMALSLQFKYRKYVTRWNREYLIDSIICNF